MPDHYDSLQPVYTRCAKKNKAKTTSNMYKPSSEVQLNHYFCKDVP